MKHEIIHTIFERGGENTAFAQYFVGQSYLNMLSTQGVCHGNVTFAPGAVTTGTSTMPPKGGDRSCCALAAGVVPRGRAAARALRAGDVVHIPAGVKHWHGAEADSWFIHLAVEVPGEGTRNEWCEPVSDEEYSKLNLLEAL